MSTPNYSYEATLADSVKIRWEVNDLIGPDKPLDFSKPFLPESLSGARGLASLSDREKLLLNQIRGNSYLHMISIAEEFVVPFMLDETRTMVPCGDAVEIRTLLTFADEEAKHIHLFRKFEQAFAAGFHSPCGVVGPIPDIVKAVLSHDKFGVVMVMLVTEWATQAHYLDSAKDAQGIDPQFKELLRHHWMEEAQHVKTDTLLLEGWARAGGPEAVARGFADFAKLGVMLDSLFVGQAELDVASLEAASGRKLEGRERADVVAAVLQAHRYTFVGAGMLHKTFLATVDKLSPGAADSMRAMAASWS